jgi:ribose transport system substrate-binding protein
VSEVIAKAARAARRCGSLTIGVAVVVGALMLAGCGGSSGGGSTGSAQGGAKKLIVLAFPFPCGLNEGIAAMCAGARAAAKDLPPGYELQIKTGVDYADNVAFNNLIQTSLQLNPAAMIIFPAGPAAQTPILNRACDQGVKIIIMDSPATGVKCQATLVGADHERLGGIVGEWLVAHPPASREVGVVTLPKGQFQANDSRVKGFVDAVEAAGYKVVATAVTDLSLDKTRTLVTNMMTSHPNLGAVFSANGPMGQGTSQALRGNRRIMHVTLDFDSTNVAPLLNGSLAAVGNQNPSQEGELSVESAVKAIEGKTLPPKINTQLSVVDKTNVQEERAKLP